AWATAWKIVRGDTVSLWLDLDPGAAERALQHLDRHLISEQVELADRTRAYAQLHLAGPQAGAVLEQALGADAAALSPLQQPLHLVAAAAGTVLRRQDPLGLPGYDVVCPPDQALAWWERLRAAGAKPAGSLAANVLRIEAGTPI